MGLETPFTCPNGHSFTADAKLRARCPECGSLARKNFQQAPATQSQPATTETPVDNDDPDKRPIHHPIKTPLLLRQGKRMPRKSTTPPKTVTKTPVAKAKPKVTVKKVAAVAKPATKVANGLVATRRVARGTTPTIKRLPKRTAPARHVTGEKSGGLSGYLNSMMRKAGF